MKTKLELIQEAWGYLWPLVKSADENGFINYDDHTHEMFWNNGDYDFFQTIDKIGFNAESVGVEKYRPISLAGIETNNGWIRIESEEDLPKEDDRRLYEAGYLDSQGNFHERNMYYFGFQLKYDLYKNLITHYRIKEDRKPPIY